MEVLANVQSPNNEDGFMSGIFGRRRIAVAAGVWEQGNAAACRKAAELARAEGDEPHATKLEGDALAWESRAVDAVRREREDRCGVYDNSF